MGMHYVIFLMPVAKKIPFSKPVCSTTILVDQPTVFENFRKIF